MRSRCPPGGGPDGPRAPFPPPPERTATSTPPHTLTSPAGDPPCFVLRRAVASSPPPPPPPPPASPFVCSPCVLAGDTVLPRRLRGPGRSLCHKHPSTQPTPTAPPPSLPPRTPAARGRSATRSHKPSHRKPARLFTLHTHRAPGSRAHRVRQPPHPTRPARGRDCGSPRLPRWQRGERRGGGAGSRKKRRITHAPLGFFCTCPAFGARSPVGPRAESAARSHPADPLRSATPLSGARGARPLPTARARSGPCGGGRLSLKWCWRGQSRPPRGRGGRAAAPAPRPPWPRRRALACPHPTG